MGSEQGSRVSVSLFQHDARYFRGDAKAAGKAAPQACTRRDIELAASIRFVQAMHESPVVMGDERLEEEEQSSVRVSGKLEVDTLPRLFHFY